MSAAQQRYDVVVIGGGAAGLSGAVALARSRRSVLVLDGGRPRNAAADGVHDHLGREGVRPGELLATGRAEVAGYGGTVVAGTAVRVERRVDGGFTVALDDGTAVLARRLLVATGLVDELPDVPGLAARWSRDVLHCPYCHGWEVRDQPIGVLATGHLADLGLEAAPVEAGGHVPGSAVAADPTGATAVPGVWVAGDVADLSAQVVVAAAAGLRAGAMINADLVAEQTRLAVARHRGGAGGTAGVRAA